MTGIQEKIIKPKLGLLELARQPGNVSQACKVMGYSRDSLYRFRERYEQGGEEALMDLSRKKPILKNRVPEHVERAVIELAIENPALGQKRASWELQQKGIMVSSSGVRSIWLRNDLETMKKRLKALEARAAQEGILLTEDQMAALEKAEARKEAQGEIESHHPGHPGSQDACYVGTMKGVGRIYQQTFVDTYARVAICKPYTGKTAITAADLLNDRVIPFFTEHRIDLLRVLTDRGTEYCGKVGNHACQLYLAVEDVDHTRTKANSPRTNGICERFHRTIKDGFYDIAFRKKLYRSVEELQTDLDAWLAKYNEQRPHSGRHCYGKTPMQTFRETLHIAVGKTINTRDKSDSAQTVLSVAG